MKILIIQQKMIGDVLTSSILFEAIKQKYPNSEIHYAINSHTHPVIENNPFIDKIQFITTKIECSKIELFKFSIKLQKEQYDVIIDVYSKTFSNIITWFSKAKIKISKYKYYTSFIYSHTFKDAKTPKTNAGLAIENRLQLLSPLKIKACNNIKPKIYLTQEEKQIAKSFLINNHINPEKPIYMISVLGSGKAKTYPFNYMAKIIDTIITTKPEAQILFNYIPKQEFEAKTIYRLCKPETQKQIHINVYRKNLRDLIAITEHCTALIGNEGGAVNMAKALNTATFTIFSPWIRKEAWGLFEDDIKNASVHLKDFKPQLFADKKVKDLKTNWKKLYHEFSPHLFTKKLKQFLTQ